MPQKICPRCRARFDNEVSFCPHDGTSLAPLTSGDALIGQTVAGRYVVHSRIGEGGMASVYLAEHLMLRRKCALKVIREGLIEDDDAVARFNREAENASRIMHPHVAAIFDFGDAGHGSLFLAMEYVAGEALSTLLARHGRLPPRRAASIVWQVADALTAAHDIEIVHRDLKPENVIIGRHRDGSDMAKVVDFGVARIMGLPSQKVTSTGMVIGTQDYMSPEQLAGEAMDARSDIYSLGILTYRMLTGHAAFEGRSPRAALEARLRGQPRPLAEVSPDVSWPAALQTALDTALQGEPGKRYPSAADFASAVVNAVVIWRPDNDAAPEPWERRLRYETPVRLNTFDSPAVRTGPAASEINGVRLD